MYEDTIPCTDCDARKKEIEEGGGYRVLDCNPIPGRDGWCRIRYEKAEGSIKTNEPVLVAIKVAENGEYCEHSLEQFQTNPMLLPMGIFKGRDSDKYVVDILNNWYGIRGTAYVGPKALGIPVEIRTVVERPNLFGVVPWDTNFEDARIRVYTENGPKDMPNTQISRIIGWGGTDSGTSTLSK